MEDPTGDQQKPPAMATYVVQSSFAEYMALMRSEQAQRDRELAAKEEELKLLDKENKLIAWINEVYTFGIMNIRTTYLKLVIRQEDKDIVQTIKKENMVNECYSIHNYISECIQNYYSD